MDMTTVRLCTSSPPEVKAIRGPHQHETVQVDNEMLVLLARNKKSEILSLHRRLEWSCPRSNWSTKAWALPDTAASPCRLAGGTELGLRGDLGLDLGSGGSRVPAMAPWALSACPREGPVGCSRVSKWDEFSSWPHFISLHRLEFTYAFLYLTAPINWHVEKTKTLFPHSPAPLK